MYIFDWYCMGWLGSVYECVVSGGCLLHLDLREYTWMLTQCACIFFGLIRIVSRLFSSMIFSICVKILNSRNQIVKCNRLSMLAFATCKTFPIDKTLTIFLLNQIVAIRDIIPPPLRNAFNDVYIAYELMDTDLHQIIRSNQALSEEHCQVLSFEIVCWPI